MTTAIDLDDLLATKEAAKLLGIKTNTLEIYRHQGKGPPFLKLGSAQGSAVRYQRSVLAAWLAPRAFRSTSEHTAAMRAASAPSFKVNASAIPAPWNGTCRNSSHPTRAATGR